MAIMTLAQCVGNTPLVRLQRLGAQTGNTLLVKLEGKILRVRLKTDPP